MFYDPLGLIQSLTVSLNILFQDICKLKIPTDQEILESLKLQWNDYMKI